MSAASLDVKAGDFLSQKRIAVAGVSRDRSHHPVGVRRVWMHQSIGRGTSVSPAAVEYCREIGVIAGACPMMYGDGVDVGHACLRWILRLTGGLPA